MKASNYYKKAREKAKTKKAFQKEAEKYGQTYFNKKTSLSARIIMLVVSCLVVWYGIKTSNLFIAVGGLFLVGVAVKSDPTHNYFDDDKN